MKNTYRLNVRFNLDNQKECEAVAHLNSLDGKSRNRFIVSAVVDAIHRHDDRQSFTLSDIQRMFREELQAIVVALPTVPTEASEEITENEVQNVLDTLEMLC